MNQDHRSAFSSRQRIDHPPPLRDKEARPKLAGQLILARVYLVRGDMFDENVIAVWALE
jgi:hypothetical protein